MRIAMSSLFGNFFICVLIDEMRQVLWVMAFIKLTSMYSAAGASGGLFYFTDQDQKKHQFPDLLHQTAVGVTFSNAKTTVHYSKVWPYTNVKVRNKHMMLWNRTRREDRETLLVWGFLSRCTCCIQVFVISRVQLVGLHNSPKIIGRSNVKGENIV